VQLRCDARTTRTKMFVMRTFLLSLVSNISKVYLNRFAFPQWHHPLQSPRRVIPLQNLCRDHSDQLHPFTNLRNHRSHIFGLYPAFDQTTPARQIPSTNNVSRRKLLPGGRRSSLRQGKATTPRVLCQTTCHPNSAAPGNVLRRRGG
jgi:hypothetical protein